MLFEEIPQTSRTRHASEWGFHISADATEMFGVFFFWEGGFAVDIF